MSVTIVGGAGLPSLLGAGGSLLKGPGGVVQSALPQLPGTTANDSYLPSHIGMTAGATAKAQAALSALPKAGSHVNTAGLNDVFEQRLQGLFSAGAPEGLAIQSGYRSPAYQARLLAQNAARNGGSPNGMVGSKFGSMHVHGQAADLSVNGRLLGNPATDPNSAWVHRNARENGLYFPMNDPKRHPYEPWHVEPIGGRRQGGVLGAQSAVTPKVDVSQMQASLVSLQRTTDQAATAIPSLTQNAAAAAPALGGVAQQAGGLGGVLQQVLGLGTGGGGGLLGMDGLDFNGGAMSELFGSIIGFNPFGFASGGYTGDVGIGRVAGVVHGSEFVAHAEATRRWRPMLEDMNAGRDPCTPLIVPAPVAASGAPAPVNVSVINNNGSKVRTEEKDDGRGGRDIKIIVDEMNADAAARPGSATSRGLQSNYGARPKLRKFG